MSLAWSYPANSQAAVAPMAVTVKEITQVRKLFVLLAGALILFGMSGTAVASVLNWEGTSTLLLGDFPRSNKVRGGGVATINSSAGLGHIETLRLKASRGNVNGKFIQLVTDPDTVANSIGAIEYNDVAATTGTFAPISGALQNTSLGLTSNKMGVAGTVRLCLVTTDCALPLTLPLLSVNGNVGVGIGGLLTIGGTGAIRISIQAAPWTIKTVTVSDHQTTTGGMNQETVGVKLTGFAHGPGSVTSSTAAVSGVVQLVTPSQVTTNLTAGSNKTIASGQTLFIRFIPEPGLLLLLGSGVAGLALIGRSRLRK